MDEGTDASVKAILADVRHLAVQYYQLTGKPLGVTGEVAEYVAAEKLGLTLAPARTKGYDATRGEERIQIKGRACTWPMKPGQRLGQIKEGDRLPFRLAGPTGRCNP
jgi:hypothetical protein